MEKNLTEAQVTTILKNAPKGTDPNKIVEGLVSRGYILQGYNDQPQQSEQPKGTSLASKAKAVVGGASEGLGTNLALSAIDYGGRKLVEKFGTDQMKQNIANTPTLNEQFKQQMGGNENPDLYSGAKTTSMVASLAPAAVEQVPKLLATPTGQKIVSKVVNPVVDTAKSVVNTMNEAKAVRNVGKVENLINPTEEMLTSLQKKEAITQGRQTIKTTKLGGTEVGYTPTAETTRAAEILSPVVKSGDKPNVVFAKIKSTIATRGAEAESYLAKNPTKITNTEDANVFSAVKAQAEKNLTKSELKAYDEQIKLFQKQLLGKKGGYTTENYYKALKEWEANIAEHLPKGKEALLDPTGVASAKIHAASDIRKAVRDLISSKHPEFKSKMYDIASLYEAKGNSLQIASKVKSKDFFEKHPSLAKNLKRAGVGAAAIAGYKGVTGD